MVPDAVIGDHIEVNKEDPIVVVATLVVVIEMGILPEWTMMDGPCPRRQITYGTGMATGGLSGAPPPMRQI